MIFILLIVDFIIMALGILKKKEKKEEPAKKEAPKEEKKAAITLCWRPPVRCRKPALIRT